MNDWPSFTVAELQRDGIVLVEDGNHGENRPRPNEFTEEGTAFIRAADLAEGQVQFNHAGCIDDVALKRIRKGIGRPGDILFSHKGTVGKLARVLADAPQFVCSPQVTFWRVLDQSRLRLDYLYAYMRSRAFIDQWWARKGETDMADYVSLTAQRQLRVTVPSLSTQQRIAEPLNALDDLIENNRRRAEVLEEMARAIYQEWFVHFRYPGHENATVESALGPIPEGWEVGRVDTHFVLQRGFDLPAKEREAGFVPVIGASGRQGFHSVARVPGPGLATGRSGTVGVVTYIPGEFWPLNTSLWVKEFRLSTPRSAYFLLSSLDLARAASGAAVPTLNRNVVHALPAVCPPRSLIEHWDLAAAPIFDSIERHRLQSERLVGLRNLLLPKLVTGEIDVSSSLDLDVLVEDSVA